MKKLLAISIQLSAFRSKSTRWGRQLVTILLLLGIPFTAYGGDAQQALLWLESTQRPDGSWCGAKAGLCERDTAEVLTTLLSVAPGLPQVGRGASFLQNVVTDDPYLLGRKLSVGRLTGYVPTDDVQKLYALKTATGGFAPPSGSRNDELHRTISALQFLSQYDLVVAGGAASSVMSMQNPDGSFGAGATIS